MAEKEGLRISELPEATDILDADYIITDNGSTTYKAKKRNVLKELKAELDQDVAILQSNDREINTRIDGIDEKIEELEQFDIEAEKIHEEINAIDRRQDALISNLNQVVDGELMLKNEDSNPGDKVIPTGTIDHAELEMLGGMSRKGYNLIDIQSYPFYPEQPEVSFERVGNGFRVTNNFQNASRIICNVPLPAGTYTVSFDVSGRTQTGGIVFGWVASGLNITINENGHYSFTKTTTSASTFMSMYAQTGETVAYQNVMIESGTVEHRYEPFTTDLIHAKVSAIESEDYVSNISNLDGWGKGINENCFNYLEHKDNKWLWHKNVGEVDLAKLPWVRSFKDGVFQTTIQDIKYVSSNTVLGNILHNKYINRLAVGFSTAVLNEIAVDTSNIKLCIDSIQNIYGALYYELAEPIITDVTDLIPADFNILDVEPGGTVSFNYEGKDSWPIDVPNKITTYIKNSLVEEINKKEDKANKVTSLANPNDITYPTTKAVNDALSSFFYVDEEGYICLKEN